MTPTLSAVVVLAPEAEPVVREHRLALDPSARRGVPAHLTVLFPFLPPASIDEEALTRLREVVRGVAGFTATLPRTGWFGDDVLYLAPEDPAPFLALTAAVTRAFPDHPPYSGRYGDVVPHLTVGQGAPRPALLAAEDAVRSTLPVHLRVSDVALLVGGSEEQSWHIAHRLPLGPR